MSSPLARCAQQVPPLAPLLVLLLAAVLGPAANGAQDEATSLRLQRQALERDFDGRESACSQRFAVNACVDAVRRQRREALAPLRERELQLDAQQRLQRADERRASIAAKQAAQAGRSTPPPPRPGSDADRVAPEPPLAAGSAAASARQGAPGEPPAQPPRRLPDADARAAQAAERARAAQQRQRAAQATQLRVESRQREREAAGRKADPLPVPASSPAAAR